MTSVLVAYATKHGGTRDVAASVAAGLRDAGVTADLRDAADIHDLTGYDAVIVGSAVYMGRWQSGALAMLHRLEQELRLRPTWLFSSGPTGGTPDADRVVARAAADPAAIPPPGRVAAFARRIGVRGHATFPGQIGTGMTGLLERWMPRGDWRDLGVVRGWARSVGAQIVA